MPHSGPDLRLVQGPEEPPPRVETRAAKEDWQLLEQVREGHSASVAALYDRVRPYVDRTIYRLLGSGNADHADLAQMALIELVTTMRRYRGECALETWVATVTARIVFKHFRRRRSERRLFEHLVADEGDLPGASARLGRDTVAKDVLRRIGVHLDKMDGVYSSAFVLHDVLGYDVREMADILGVSAAAAQSRLVRGRKQVHERIAADPELAPLLLRTEGTS
jgi:RNA polymerase sigma-70 factor (ECF subfamily)